MTKEPSYEYKICNEGIGEPKRGGDNEAGGQVDQFEGYFGRIVFHLKELGPSKGCRYHKSANSGTGTVRIPGIKRVDLGTVEWGRGRKGGGGVGRD